MRAQVKSQKEVNKKTSKLYRLIRGLAVVMAIIIAIFLYFTDKQVKEVITSVDLYTPGYKTINTLSQGKDYIATSVTSNL